MNRFLALALALAPAATVAGCGHTDPASPPDARVERIAQLERIAAKCGLPGTLKLVGNDDVRFKPSTNARYERVDCVLTALKKTDMPMKMGFVGNEAYDIGNQQ